MAFLLFSYAIIAHFLPPSLLYLFMNWYLFSDLSVDVYNIGGGSAVPVGSEYLGCMRDEKTSNDARALFEGLLKCYNNMTTQVSKHRSHDLHH